MTVAVGGAQWPFSAVQVVPAMVMYGKIGSGVPPSWIDGLQRWVGRVAVLTTVPVVVHCLYTLGFQTSSTRVLARSLLGCFFYRAFVTKMLPLDHRGVPGWAVPPAGGAVFALPDQAVPQLVVVVLRHHRTDLLTGRRHMSSAEQTPNRRTVLAGAGATACGLALTACSGYSSGDGSSPTPGTGGGAVPGAGRPVAKTTDIPVGSGVIVRDADVVVTHPEPAVFQAFDATCTHQGCTVNQVAGGIIDCPCHGSRFSITDGAPVAGPAKQPLPARPISVNGDTIIVA